ncbi:MAG: 3-demethylubiquinone-9 3-methyltransferase [Candidatus Pacebacteria bacterium GW2011_GWA1_46_10]|nr:MAG: 3-demethylubiquinone-9 3-methyltransferase [Candidatus Pacebacteria bacterium GW2011_GWA1_46_10]HCR80982.1 hypothetical protein [Candidatus Paceibacterota bacterium]
MQLNLLKFKVLSNFAFLPWVKRSFIFLRLASCPFMELITYLPKKGKLLDVGTGFGLLPLLLKQHNSQLQIIGIDPDAERIKLARQANQNLSNFQFQVGTVLDLDLRQTFTVATLVDVLYLLPQSEKIKTIQAVYRLLEPNSLLVIKINDKSFSLSYFFTWLQEKMTVQIFKETTTNFPGLYFENAAEVSELLENNGFQVQKRVKLKTPFPFFHPHWLVVAQKKN